MAVPPPPYPEGRNLLGNKTVVITAAAGTGIGFATAKRCLEESAGAVLISDIHDRRLQTAAEELEKLGQGRVFQNVCNVTQEEDVAGLLFADPLARGGPCRCRTLYRCGRINRSQPH